MGRKGQIWIETVLYTLIGLALIGIVLAIATPSINARKDRIIVEQTIDSLNNWDEKINSALEGPGNRRIISAFVMKKGSLYINSSGDSISILIEELSKPYSEPGIPIELGPITILSKEGKKKSSIELTLNYQDIANITYQRTEELGEFDATTTPYSFKIENLGNQEGSEIIIIDIEETSRG